MNKIVVYLLLIGFIAFTFLFSGDPNKDSTLTACPANYVSLNKYMGFPVNCDAFVFIGGAIQPSYLLKPGYERQSRPLYILMGSVAGYTIYYITYPIHNRLQQFAEHKFPAESKSIDAEKATLYVTFYIGYILINIILLLFSLFLFEKILIALSGPWKNGRLLFLSICGLLLSNQLMQHFFWTVHVQLFNLLTPLLCLYLSLIIMKNKISTSYLFFLTFCFGCLLLAYGNFLLLIPALLFSYIYRSRSKLSLLNIIWHSLLLLFLFFLPVMAWSAFLELQGISFHSSEIEKYRQFVWLIDSFNNKQSSFLSVFIKNTFSYLNTFGGLLFLFFLLSLSHLSFQMNRETIQKDNRSRMRYGISIILPSLIAIGCFIFFWFLGYYADRLTATISPLLVSLIALQINQRVISISLRLFFCFLIFAWHIYIIIVGVPHFSTTFYN